ncbi:hypothetical protein M2H09_22515 [Vibrio vulnificus]|nr:hypothetical protein [Vibrio vulnificus]MCU8208074.1 hypothetical protein [Vibrio vulnificus]
MCGNLVYAALTP